MKQLLPKTKVLIEKGKKRNMTQAHVTMSYDKSTDELFQKSFGNLLRFWIPYSIDLSKNRLWRTTIKGRIYTPTTSRKLIQQITDIVKSSKIKWNINKVYLEIIVQKPNMRGDAINFLDSIADGVKKGINLDDNWFAVEKLDWELVKKDPRIYISIYQENEDKYPCRFCGIFQTFDNYGKDKGSKYGITGECKNCTRVKRK